MVLHQLVGVEVPSPIKANPIPPGGWRCHPSSRPTPSHQEDGGAVPISVEEGPPVFQHTTLDLVNSCEGQRVMIHALYIHITHRLGESYV